MRSAEKPVLKDKDQYENCVKKIGFWVANLSKLLAAILKFEGFPISKIYLQKEHFSLRKILTENGAKTIKAPDQGALINVNTPEDAKRIREIFAKKGSV